MNFEQLAAQLANQAETIRALALGVSEEQASWRPDPDSWSILEVINHLYDEEREDFRRHLDDILHHPDQAWHRIDPQGWVMERQYNQRDFEVSLNNFLTEREASVAWLKGLTASNWETVFEAPFGKITAGDMFASWVAHDLLHTRQVVELHYAYTLQAVHPHRVAYAGPW